MTIEELNKLVDLEIQWLYYYGSKESKNKLNENSNIYNDLISIGYTKRVIKLDLRCCPCIITSEKLITTNTNLSDLIITNGLRGENKLSPIETYIKIYPHKKMDILNKLKK